MVAEDEEAGKVKEEDEVEDPRAYDSSVFAKSGVDMSISKRDDDKKEINNLSKIFPSMGRGRGRGRGAYMR